jgi:isochorismate synthase
MWVDHDASAAFASAGVARRIVLRGTGRLEELRRGIGETFSRIHVVAQTAGPAPEPRFFGGLAFAPGAGEDPPWSELADGAFVLPRWTYAVLRDRATLTLALGADDPRDLAAIDDELESIVATVTGDTSLEGVPAIGSWQLSQLDVESWTRMVAAAQDRLARGELQKVVVARRSEVPIATRLRDVSVLARLCRELVDCTCFAFRGREATFLGATPETLFTKRGDVVETEALAGTIRSIGTDFPRLRVQTDKILASEKDLHEHAVVVDEIAAAIGRLGGVLGERAAPRPRKVRNIIHLHTPLRATLPAEATAIDLLAALHPTPAVGGMPTRAATEFIAEIEPARRGWYAGPVGWIDRRGDARFCIAIRSGLIAHPTAYVYAGAGIMSQSDPEAEYAETGLKQMPMMLALGVDSASLRSTIAPSSGRRD